MVSIEGSSSGDSIGNGLKFVGTMTNFFRHRLTFTPRGQIFPLPLTIRPSRGLVTFQHFLVSCQRKYVKVLQLQWQWLLWRIRHP